MQNSSITRRSFLSAAIVGVAAIGSQLLLSACSSGSSYGSSGSGSTTNQIANGGNCNSNGSSLDTTGVTDSHTHTIQLTAAEIQAGNTAAVFTTSVYVDHSHDINLSTPDYTNLQNNQGISLTTEPGGTDGHVHTIVINCA